jgi:hypothetical protein
VQRLVERVQLAQRLRYEVEKLDKAGVLVWNQGRDKRDNDAAIAALEELLLGEAEMVFATLSSTQRDVFKKVTKKMPFRTGEATIVLLLFLLRFLQVLHTESL